MNASPLFVNHFVKSGTPFPQDLYVMFPIGYTSMTVNRMWKKRLPGLLFFAILGLLRRLAIRPGAIGDFILSLPALECLAPQSEDGKLEIWTSSAHVPLVRFTPHVRAIASTGLDLLGVAEPPPRLLEELSAFDSIVSWYGANRPEFRQYVASLGLPFRFFPALPAADCRSHATDFYLDQVRTIVECRSDGIARICCKADDAGIAESGDFAVIHPFSGSASKNWPIDRFRTMARGLERRMTVRWCAGPEDPALPKAVYINNLYRLACWLAQARIYIGNDSGITHLAAAAGAPVLALFGPSDPEIWAPRGANVRVARWSAR